MKYVAHTYQERMTDLILTGQSVALWADMGLGKTSAVLTALSRLSYIGGKTLVIAPKRVAEETWPDELLKWDHLSNLRFIVLKGTAAQRLKLLEQDADVYLMCRNLLPWIFKAYTHKSGNAWKWTVPWPFSRVVIDESSAFKSASGQWFKTMARIARSGCQIIELTGTPSPKFLEDLWSQTYLLDRGQRLENGVGKFRSKYMQVAGYIRTSSHDVPMYSPKPDAYKAVMGLLEDITISLNADDWLKMPKRIFNDVVIQMPKKARKMYDEVKDDAFLRIGGSVITGGSPATVLGKLLQMCNGYVYDEEEIPVFIHDAKAAALKQIIEDATSPVLVMYNYKHDIPAILAAHPNAEPIDQKRWNAGEIPVMYCHPASAGHGLNLQAGGNTIVWYGIPFNLELYLQANARLYRQGQKQESVIIHHLVMADTVEQMVSKALQRKDFNQQQILDQVRYVPKIK